MPGVWGELMDEKVIPPGAPQERRLGLTLKAMVVTAAVIAILELALLWTIFT